MRLPAALFGVEEEMRLPAAFVRGCGDAAVSRIYRRTAPSGYTWCSIGHMPPRLILPRIPLCCALFSTILFGQFSGRLAGTVLDASGAAVPGATVSLYLPQGDKPVLSTKTVADGTWRLIGVRV